ncbi:hypothetical protein PMSD_18440 [Paenibacillus macquariensis subsp. defensor]|nr:hypothetical protein PMSD_18440 [Paenibacillus macquariensis subsp. defensor]
MALDVNDVQKKELNDIEFLDVLADELNNAERVYLGGHGEGAKVIQISDELAKEIAVRLKSAFNWIENIGY